jgi:xylulokinase
VKALLLDPEGENWWTVAEPCLTRLREGLAEANPAEWWRAAKAALSRVLTEASARPARVGQVSVSGNMSSVVLIDQRGSPLRDAILLTDTRGEAELATLPVPTAHRVRDLSGNPLNTSFSLAKLLWLARNDPAAMEKATVWLAAKDFVRSCLSGQASTDPSDAFNSLLLDPVDLSWQLDLAEACGLAPGMFPPVSNGTEPAGEVTSRAARETGLSTGTPILTGLGDMASLAVGVGWTEQAAPAVSLGTSVTVLLPAAPASRPPDGFSVHPVLPGVSWLLLGSLLTGGLALDWLRRLAPLAPGEVHRQAGLVFLPQLSGKGSPCFNPSWRGSLLGIEPSTDMGAIAQALFDAIAFELRGCGEALGTKLDEITVTGGGSALRPWLQAIADVLQTSVRSLNVSDGSAFGAALLAVGPARGAAIAKRARQGVTVEPQGGWDVEESYARYLRTSNFVARMYEPMGQVLPRKGAT